MNFIIFFLSLALFTPHDSTNHETHLLDQMQGQWQADGLFMGQDAQATIHMGAMIEGQSYRLHIDIRQAAPNSDIVIFEGIGVYLPGQEANARGFWTDSQANLYPLTSSLDGSRMITLWGNSEEPYGRSTYTMREDGQMNVVDEIYSNTGWQTFADLTYTRVDTE